MSKSETDPNPLRLRRRPFATGWNVILGILAVGGYVWWIFDVWSNLEFIGQKSGLIWNVAHFLFATQMGAKIISAAFFILFVGSLLYQFERAKPPALVDSLPLRVLPDSPAPPSLTSSVAQENVQKDEGKQWYETAANYLTSHAPDHVKAISAPAKAPEEIKPDQDMACINTFIGHFEFQNGETPILRNAETSETFIGAITELVKSPDATGWVGGVDFLEAQITYLKSDGSFAHRISDCLWIGQGESYIRGLSAGARVRLIVAMAAFDKVLAPERRREGEFFLLADEKYYVIINLNTNSKPLKFELTITPQLGLTQM